jgi:hypothetical protein
MMGKTIHFGIICPGLIGKESASAIALWCHLPGDKLARPVIAGIYDTNVAAYGARFLPLTFNLRRHSSAIKYDSCTGIT